ncbi:CHAT domain-containing protein [Haliangium sp.]|uniref:CHAT domain-containing protein n=1 Tax=Haliangium sp. TaxID=2663208 RepID=UPI003D116E3C
MKEFIDLEIRVGALVADQAGYPVSLRGEPVGECQGLMSPPDPEQLAAAALRVDTAETGRLLYEALFPDRIRSGCTAALAVARSDPERYGGVRVRLCISPDAPELHALPWERVYLDDGAGMHPLAADGRTPFSRTLAQATRVRSGLGERPVRMLFAVANPHGMSPEQELDVSAELESLDEALAAMPPALRARLEVSLMPGRTALSGIARRGLASCGYAIVPGPTSLDNLMNAWQQGPGFDLFHLVAHGAFAASTEGRAGKTTLALETADGELCPVADQDFVTKLGSATSRPRLVFLSACHSAERDPTNAMLGLAPKLVQQDVPAVVAMQHPIAMEHNRTLVSTFYRRLLEHGVVDLAMNQARAALFTSESLDWSTPALYMRLADARLLDPGVPDTDAGSGEEVADTPPAPPPPPPKGLVRLSTREQRDRLAILLEDCDSLQSDFTRAVLSSVIQSLGKEIYSRVKSHPTLQMSLTDLVTHCSNRTGYVDKLVEAVRVHEGESDQMKAIDAFVAPLRQG